MISIKVVLELHKRSCKEPIGKCLPKIYPKHILELCRSIIILRHGVSPHYAALLEAEQPHYLHCQESGLRFSLSLAQ
jgi:hypothetical protein